MINANFSGEADGVYFYQHERDADIIASQLLFRLMINVSRHLDLITNQCG